MKKTQIGWEQVRPKKRGVGDIFRGTKVGGGLKKKELLSSITRLSPHQRDEEGSELLRAGSPRKGKGGTWGRGVV